jgi:MFS family permease
MTGPTVGGFLMQLGGWPWIFWMNAIVGFAVTAAVALIFKGPGEQRREPFDFYGSAALLIGYPALLVALTFGAKTAWTSPEVLLAFGVGVIGIASFVRIELHTAKPLVDLALFRRRTLTGALISAVLCQLIYSPITLCAPLYLQNVLGASAMTAGFLLAILPLSTAIASPLSGRLADRFEASKVSGFGVIAIALAIGFYSRLHANASFTAAAVVLALLGAGIGVFTPANQKVAFASVTQQDFGLLAAMLSSFGTAAGTVGTTITVALMESDGGARLWSAPETLARAQQFAFACLLPLGLLAIVIAFCVRSTRPALKK